ncbi:AraC family transcriptional regulator [Dactylosporangium aurantiacum]|uniref:AraC family transcriptional regulator n=1 Tax=Dactylosporangium aurantiacum TaxID=35754 RepID=A0A9Q9MQN3_9ACTN|nr:AraC family transcriptional regulator [Dactylosporangium aurantiacum]MDG6103245.1 AraC family transcriptional regulator [Dactylosporangium aurantiacum]UWZ57747.1 AraC family transcriptional regulator [Dactylosporangium aurantiacum]
MSRRVKGVDEARALCHEYFYPIRLEPVEPSAPLPFSFDALVAGPVTLAQLEFGAAIRMSHTDLDTAYHVNVPLSGTLRAVHRGVEVEADPTRAVVFGPHGQIRLDRWGSGDRVLCVKLDRAALHEELESLLGRPVRGPLELAPAMGVTSGAALSWVRLLRLLSTDLHNAGGLVSRAPIAEGLGREALRGLLYAAGHRHLTELLEPAAPARPRTVQRAVDAIRADPARAFTVTELAAVAGVSVRALQEGFRRHVGLAPLAMLRRIRLGCARDELLAAGPHEVTVAEVAHRWGFGHLGRFAAAYRARFGETPSATLHR